MSLDYFDEIYVTTGQQRLEIIISPHSASSAYSTLWEKSHKDTTVTPFLYIIRKNLANQFPRFCP